MNDNIRQSVIIRLDDIRRALRSKSLWIPYAACLLLTLLYHWDPSHAFLYLFRVSLRSEEYRVEMHCIFYETYLAWWCFSLAWLFRMILFPLANSFTVSHVLWLRSSGVRGSTLALSRIIFLLIAVTVVAVLSLLWIVIFTLRHSLPIDGSLFTPVIGFVGYILFGGGLVLLLEDSHLLDNNTRMIFVMLAAVLPMVSFYFRDDIQSLHDYWPYAIPVFFHGRPPDINRGYFLALGAGMLLLAFHWIKKLSFQIKINQQ